jgi:DNA-binding transcriptional LysR family regulator
VRFAGLVALPFAPSDCSALLVSVEVLAALDALLWLRTGDRAAAHLQCTQSTVSRHSRRCLQVFGLHMEKRAGEWCLRGDQTLIDLERSVHQLLRWRQGRRLRLDSQHWCSHWLATETPSPWAAGNLNYLEYQRPQELLCRGVIDAWLCSAPELPHHPGLYSIPLTAMPMDLLVKPGHPLLDLGDQLDWEHLADFPVLPLPDGAFPKAQAVLEALGLWSCPERDRRFQQAPWFGLVPVEEWMISFGTPLQRAAGLLDGLLPLPLSLPIRVGEAVAVKREFAANPHLLSLLAALGERARLLARGLVEVELLLPSESELAER